MEMILLASQSPRRKELISLLPWPFEVCVKEVEEKIDLAQPAWENVKKLALQKAQAVAQARPNEWVIGADTVVCYETHILGKPKSETAAYEMLKMLSGKVHKVYTGVAIMNKEKGYVQTFYEETKVTMQELTDEEIDAYISTKEPLDKAGAYGIQGFGARYIEGIECHYFNVVCLPVHAVYKQLSNALKENR